MKNRTIRSVEIICVLIFTALFLIHAITGFIKWEFIISPLVLMGIIRLFVMYLVAIYNISNLYYWIKWKITGVARTKKQKEKSRKKKGQGMRC